MIYAFGPFQVYHGSPTYYGGPAGTLAVLDFRPLSEQAEGATQSARGFFALPDDAVLDSGYELVGRGQAAEIKADGLMRSTFASVLGHDPSGDTLAELLFDTFLRGSDPDGQAAHRPLQPAILERRTGPTLWMDLYLVGRVKSGPFEWGKHPHTNRLRDLLRREFRHSFEAAKAGLLRDPEHHLRHLDALCDKYSLRGRDDWKQLVDADILADVPGRKPHQTSISENFDGADSATVGVQLTWTDLEGDWRNVTNAAEHNTSSAGNQQTSRADSDLSSTDVSCQGVLLNIPNETDTNRGVLLRKDSTATLTHYHFDAQDSGASDDSWRTFKRVAGGYTLLGVSTSLNVVANDTLKGEANGSTITRYRNGSSQNSSTDTAITTGLRCGLNGNRAMGATQVARVDDWSAADLAGSGILYTQLERNVRGMVRGTYAGAI